MNLAFHISAVLLANCWISTAQVGNDLLLERDGPDDTTELAQVDVYAEETADSRFMRTVEGIILTTGKKTQYIDLSRVDGNQSTNNARELLARVPGLNIWESDGGGLQLGIGARGLSPSRTAHFNTRQNGYDISADPMGYPETYYTPPTAALEGIQFIRGAASLQFGPQFGGMVNFRLRPASTKPVSYRCAHTYGSWNLINTFNCLSGTLKKKFSYNFYHQYKRGDGWRENSGFAQHQAHGQLKYQFNEKLFLSVEHTYMSYLAQQAGGLTDQMFESDPRQSIRDRNWFQVNWHISALNLSWKISPKTLVDLKIYRVMADRSALGNLDKISHTDDMAERDLISGNFENFGSELRLLEKYNAGKLFTGVLAGGFKFYQGTTLNRQGKSDSLSGPNFAYTNPSSLEGSDFRFPTRNVALFAEHMFWLNKKLSFSVGGRYEYISTSSSGYYRETTLHPLTGAVLFDTTYTDSSSRIRSVFLAGGGFSWRPTGQTEVYWNAAQCYRPINFSDIRIINPNETVDPDIQDEKGFNADLGIRGSRKRYSFDFSGFALFYDNKIGSINQKVDDYNYVRLRTNLGFAYSTGTEFYGEYRWNRSDSSRFTLAGFVSGAMVYARYGRSLDASVSGNQVELVPPLTARGGLRVELKNWRSALTASYVYAHFSDATNAISDASAVSGVIPSYYVLDFSTSVNLKPCLRLAGGVNNFTNNKYYTRRATSYPGPGIIPSDGINFYLTLEIRL